MTPPDAPRPATVELEQFLTSLSASRARLEALSTGVDLPELNELVEEVDVLTEQLLTADAELRAQETELAEVARRAEHAVRRWENMFARSGTAYYLSDADGVITNSNLAARQLLHERESAPTQIRPIASKFAVDDRRAVREALRRAVADGETSTVRAQTHVHPGGTARAVDVSVTPVHAPGEEVALWWQLVPVENAGGGASDVSALAASFELVAEAVHGSEDPHQAMQRIVELIPAHLPAVEHVGISAFRRGRLSTLAASGPLPEQVDALQHRTGQGPCVDALLTQSSYRTGDLTAETRWPVFARLCVQETPVRSVMAFRMPVDDQTVGALNCYASSRNAFEDAAIAALGAVFAAHTALAFAAIQRQEQAANLNTALTSSRLIGAAVGILMAHHRVTQEQAFELLREASQRKHRKLRDVADDVVQTGDIG